MPHELIVELPRLSTAGSLARSAVSDSFAEELGRDRVGELLLVVSELVTNAVLYGRGAITLKLRFERDGIFGEVVDQGRGFEREVRERGPDEFDRPRPDDRRCVIAPLGYPRRHDARVVRARTTRRSSEAHRTRARRSRTSRRARRRALVLDCDYGRSRAYEAHKSVVPGISNSRWTAGGPARGHPAAIRRTSQLPATAHVRARPGATAELRSWGKSWFRASAGSQRSATPRARGAALGRRRAGISGRAGPLSDLGASPFHALPNAAGDPLPVTFKGQLLRTDRARIRFLYILADALDVAALRRSVGHGTRGLVSMVRHAAGSSRDGASRDARC